MPLKYHDDGESSLGPTITTLSLGAKATMKIRLKDKYFRGFTASKKLLDNDPVLVSCDKYKERKELKSKWEKKEITDGEYNKLRAELAGQGKRKEATPVINLDIQHGDLVVMHGANLQKYFEVRPLLPKIMTCRLSHSSTALSPMTSYVLR
jgi:hypothetical protein